MAETGYFPVEELKTCKALGSRLQGHPDRRNTPGIEAGTGSLVQRLSVANGMAIDLRIKDLNSALETGHQVGAPLPLTASIMEMMQTLHADGRGNEDHSSLANYLLKYLDKKLESECKLVTCIKLYTWLRLAHP